MSFVSDAEARADLERIAFARRQLVEIVFRLGGVQTRLASLVCLTNWQTESARRFHVAVLVWCDDITATRRAIDSAEAQAAWDQLRRSLAVATASG